MHFYAPEHGWTTLLKCLKNPRGRFFEDSEKIEAPLSTNSVTTTKIRCICAVFRPHFFAAQLGTFRAICRENELREEHIKIMKKQPLSPPPRLSAPLNESSFSPIGRKKKKSGAEKPKTKRSVVYAKTLSSFARRRLQRRSLSSLHS